MYMYFRARSLHTGRHIHNTVKLFGEWEWEWVVKIQEAAAKILVYAFVRSFVCPQHKHIRGLWNHSISKPVDSMEMAMVRYFWHSAFVL
jgi:hypothetical protein